MLTEDTGCKPQTIDICDVVTKLLTNDRLSCLVTRVCTQFTEQQGPIRRGLQRSSTVNDWPGRLDTALFVCNAC
jgi:hypothetical protein